MSKKIVHTCYGCPYYYRVNGYGKIEYLKPHSYKHCGIEDWECDYFANGGEPAIKTKEVKGGGVSGDN